MVTSNEAADSGKERFAELRESLREGLQSFEHAKLRGNSFFKLADFECAVICYMHALGCGDTSDADRVAACGNLAQCELRLGHPRDALKWCDEALSVEPRHSKNLYRKALALEILNDLPAARKALDKALAACTEADAKIRGEINDKLHNIVLRVQAQVQVQRDKVAEVRRQREQEVQQSRPHLPERYESDASVQSPYVYQEKDWTPWLRQQLRHRIEADPADPLRLRVDTAAGICMAFLPTRLPDINHTLQMMRYMQQGSSNNAGNAPPAPLQGKELQDSLTEKMVQGDAVYWRRGPRSGLRFELTVVLFWRAVERQLDGATVKLEGVVQIQISDEVEPAAWKVHVAQDPPDPRSTEKPPKGKALESLLTAANALAERLRTAIQELLREIEGKNAQE